MLARIRRSWVAAVDPVLGQFVRERRQLMPAPYPLAIYRRLLEDMIKAGAELPAFSASGDGGGGSVYVRHDVDTADCVKHLEDTMAVDRALGVSSGVYFRLDAEDYDFGSVATRASELASQGFEVGLHTSCYDYEDPLRRFSWESDRFETLTGFRARSFTLHGLGRKSHFSRLRFRRYMARHLGEFGYAFSDCHRSLRQYRYVIEDCHIGSPDGTRFIYDDFENGARLIRPGSDLLVLTHPCYWHA